MLADTCARRVRAPNYPAGIPEDIARQYIHLIIEAWGTGRTMLLGAPGMAADPARIELRARLERLAMSPGEFAAMYPPTYEIDIRPLLETIRVPTLVLHRSGNPYIRVDNGR
ncbi:MAG: hypothetical protein GWN54_12505, partial [Gammaproteobacteria bacterium]|nr:hypothetical protein [Gammaproteobacteria bacterium]